MTNKSKSIFSEYQPSQASNDIANEIKKEIISIIIREGD